MSSSLTEDTAWLVLGRHAGEIVVVGLNEAAEECGREVVAASALSSWVRATERPGIRWVWSDTANWYPALLEDGVRVARCHDLRLNHAILRDAAAVSCDELRAAREWDVAATSPPPASAPTLFDLDGGEPTVAGSAPAGIEETLAEFARQRTAIASSTRPSSLRLLLAAESAGALAAAELHAAGVPWDAAAHRRLLVSELGEQPSDGGPPGRMQALAAEVRDALGDPSVSLDSQPRLLRALHRAGVLVTTTSKWELREQQHPVVAPLLEYKRLARLYTANGWAWLDEWVADGRFRPVYTPGGVVTGRWASTGGGALQVPRQLRTAVRADPGWRLVVADVSQLEPRVLAAMSGDLALAEAARGRDLYEGIVATGALRTRAEAKIAVLGAMYGATTGDSGRLVPRLRRAFPRAMALVDEAARIGETGGVVSTRLGRTSPGPSEAWRAVQAHANSSDSSEADQTRARRWARDRGRFTRNFVVQGTAAEWALAWLADLRGRLAALPPVSMEASASASGPVFSSRAHLAFYLHDEIVVHAPAEQADAAASAVWEAAASAARLLFGDFPLDFRLDLKIAKTAEKD